MKRAKSGSGGGRSPKMPEPPPVPKPRAPGAVLAAQRRRLLSKHYINKYRVRRGR